VPSSYRRERLLGLRRPFSRDHPHCTAGSVKIESSTRKLACSRGALATVQPGYSRSRVRTETPVLSATYFFASECVLRARARSHWAAKRFSVSARDLQWAAKAIASCHAQASGPSTLPSYTRL